MLCALTGGAAAIAASVVSARGSTALSVAASLSYGALILTTALRYDRLVAWSRRHRVLDSLFVIPAIFFALALLTRVALGWCTLIAVASWVLLAPLAPRRRTRT